MKTEVVMRGAIDLLSYATFKELNNEFDSYYEIARLVTDRVEVQYDDYLFVLDKIKVPLVPSK